MIQESASDPGISECSKYQPVRSPSVIGPGTVLLSRFHPVIQESIGDPGVGQ